MNEHSLDGLLKAGLGALGEDPLAHPCERYLAYIDLLDRWNRAYNLSGIREKPRMLTHHLLDCLAVLPYLRGSTGLDVGSGAGLPGFILALARPDMQWVLVDSNQKKTRFLNQAVLELAPGNVEIANTRIEDYRASRRFSTIVCRALMSAPVFCELTDPLLASDGGILMMKGAAVEEEGRALDTSRYVSTIESLKVPGLNAERHLLIVEKTPDNR